VFLNLIHVDGYLDILLKGAGLWLPPYHRRSYELQLVVALSLCRFKPRYRTVVPEHIFPYEIGEISLFSKKKKKKKKKKLDLLDILLYLYKLDATLQLQVLSIMQGS
jgi:hypothetical protein